MDQTGTKPNCDNGTIPLGGKRRQPYPPKQRADETLTDLVRRAHERLDQLADVAEGSRFFGETTVTVRWEAGRATLGESVMHRTER